MNKQQMLAHDFGNGGGADAVTEIAVLGRNFLEKQKNLLILPEIGSLGGVL